MRPSSTGGDIRGAQRETSRTKLSSFFEHFKLKRYHDERILVLFTIFTITETRLIFSVISVLFAYLGNICISSEIEEKIYFSATMKLLSITDMKTASIKAFRTLYSI